MLIPEMRDLPKEISLQRQLPLLQVSERSESVQDRKLNQILTMNYVKCT